VVNFSNRISLIRLPWQNTRDLQMGANAQQSSGFGTGALAAGVMAAWVVLGLIGHEPWKPDEAYTFGLVWHILETGEWLVPTLGGLPFVEKPPLFFWTAAVFAKLFAWALPLHDAARLAAGFYVALTLWFTWLASGKRLAAPVLLAGSLGYLQHAHQLVTDNALMAGIAMGAWGLARGNGFLLGTGAGIAFLSKGLLGPGMLAISALALLAFPAWRVRRHALQLGWAALAFLPWALIWPALLYLRSRALFDEWFWVNNFGRFSGSAGLGGVLDHWLYLKALPWFALPTLPLAAWTLGRAWRSRSELRSPELLLPATLFVVMLGILSTASSARTIYGLPMLVPLALLGALAVDGLPERLRAVFEHIGFGFGVLVMVVFWGAWLALLIGWPAALAARLAGQSPSYVAHVAAVPLLFALAVSCGWLCVVLIAARDSLRMPIVWTAGIAAAWGLAMTLWLPFLDDAKSYRSVASAMQDHVPAGSCVAGRNLTEPQRAMFHYYSGVVAGRECPLLLVHTSDAAPPAAGQEWTLVWRGTRPGDAKEFFWLFSSR
jgi:4-amino-4-deoxy-L-arabinose transferase-like glycosyltransferase